MNIIHLDREAFPDMGPLAQAPHNPHIALHFQSCNDEWCTPHFPNMQPIDPNLYKNPTPAQLYALLYKYKHSQINHLKQHLQLHFNSTEPPTIIPKIYC